MDRDPEREAGCSALMVIGMASRVVTQLISDLSGAEISEGEGEAVDFSYRGTHYTIDLTASEAADFDEAMSLYLQNATRCGRGNSSSASAPRARRGAGDAKAVREWAREQGIDVPQRGRIPAEVRSQYDASH